MKTNILKKLEKNEINKTKQERFIIKANLVHGNKYDYSLVEYNKSQIKVKIICPEHGVFEQVPANHLFGKECITCSYDKRSVNKLKTTEYFIAESTKIHGNRYNYSLVEYKDSKTKVKIICSIHGEFEQTPNGHLKGNNCDKCGGSSKLTIGEFIKKSDEIHSNKYDYSLSEYVRTDIKINIICPKHGIFNQLVNNHLRGYGCPICKESKGEKEIRNHLIKNNIKFIQQHKFDDCKNIKPLPFDFYLPDYNTCIEFNGKQHYEPIKYFGGRVVYDKLIKRDKIKMEYCHNNNIPLIILKYDEKVIDGLNTCLKIF